MSNGHSARRSLIELNKDIENINGIIKGKTFEQ